ncbi:MAG: DEAD/DEAH box helicase [Acidobacteria bacterium]|nr:DEAD/DEAH box helicase [Acidobacteriota bacterium]
MQDVADYFRPEAVEALRRLIRQNHGHEVFCVATLDDALKVASVRVVARGNRNCVPAVLEAAEHGMMVIHNHPGGDLTPSENDVGLAAEFAGRGVASCIVDNAVSRLHVTVEPMRKAEAQDLRTDEIVSLFSRDGQLAAALEGFEHRPQQERMAAEVVRAFNEKRVALVEAATGVGKSLAYLIPAIRWALDNKKRVVVSTNTINLQEQLIHKDIPFLKQRLGMAFEAVLMKGRHNYLCLRKLEDLRKDPVLSASVENAEELSALVEWSGKTQDGSRSDLGIPLSWETWELVACESDACLFAKCPHFSKCFLFMARRAAAKAQLIVANHHLLMADMAVREQSGPKGSGGVLPEFHRLVLDEAHHVEDVAAKYFGVRLTPWLFVRNLGRLQNARDPSRGLVPGLAHSIGKAAGRSAKPLAHRINQYVEDVFTPARAECRKTLDRLFDGLIREVLSRREKSAYDGTELKIRISRATEGTPLWEDVIRPAVADAAAEVIRLTGTCGRLTNLLYKLPPELLDHVKSPVLDLEAAILRLRTGAEKLDEFLEDSEDTCRWIEIRRRRDQFSLAFEQAPLDVAPRLSKTIFDRYEAVILTSATLSVGRKFDFVKARSGLALQPPERITETVLESPFDYRNRVLFAVPRDLPDPTDRAFLDATVEAVRKAVHATEGGAFVLFTSYSHLSHMHRTLEGPLGAAGFNLLRQGSADRHRLLEDFKALPKAVLFAVDSFWEGVDVKGRALRSVIIVKLPFQVPTEPLVEARLEKIKRDGGNPFSAYSLPHAVLKLKQGFGRLIRSHADWGMVLICDHRVMTKPYGREFLDALPRLRPLYAPLDEILLQAGRFQEQFEG